MKDHICIYRGRNLVEIELTKSKLDDAQIPYLERTNDACGMLSHLSHERGTEILIPKDHQTQAQEILNALES